MRYSTFLAGLLLLILLATAVLAEPPGKGEPPSDVEALKQSIEQHRWAALAWCRMTRFDRARKALNEADVDYRAIVALGDGPPTDRSWHTWDLGHELQKIDGYERAHQRLLDRFDLPENTLGFIDAGPYMDNGRDPIEGGLWYAIYTVPPEGITTAEIATYPLRYFPGSHLPGSRSFIATFEPLEGGGEGQPRRWQRIERIEAPEDRTPVSVRVNHGGRLLVDASMNTGEGEMPESHQVGVMLIHRGKLIQLTGGACAGPAMTPRNDADVMLLPSPLGNSPILIQRGEERDILCHYSQGRIDITVTFEEGNIVTITDADANPEGETRTVFDADAIEGDRMSHEQVKQLGWYYGVMQRQYLRAYPVHFHEADKIEYDSDTQRWTLMYEWGDPRIRGGSRSIVLGKDGRLISFHEDLVLR